MVDLRGYARGGAWSLVYVGCTGEVPEEDDGTNGGPLISVVKRRHVLLEDASDG